MEMTPYQRHQWNKLKDLPKGTWVFLNGEPVILGSKDPIWEEGTLRIKHAGKWHRCRDMSLLQTELIVDKPY